ncbi:MAG: type II secretion system protein [Gemmatimonadaceae bacterium]
MKNDAGYTLVELVVAAAVMLTITAGMFSVLGDGLGRSALWNETADLHQRARVALDVVASELLAAGAGAASGPLNLFLPPVEPKRQGSALSINAVTVRYVPDNAAASTLTSDLAPEGLSATVAIHSGCPLGTEACGFTADMDVVLFDDSGNWDMSTVQSAAGATVTLINVLGSRSTTYSAGARIAQVIETTLFADAAVRQLRRERPGGAALPVVDDFIDLQLSYFGDPFPPAAPVPPPGAANCLFTSSGDRIAHPVLPQDHGGLAALPLSMLQDGPFCGAGERSYDLDLLRIRSVRAIVRLQSGADSLRGQDLRLFARPGSATLMERMIPDAVLSIELTPRNLQR